MRASATIGNLLIVAGAIIMLAAPAMAGNGKGSGLGQGGGDRTRTQSRLKDGSCRIDTEKQDIGLLLVHNGAGAGDCTSPDPICTCAGKNCYCEEEA